MLKILELSKKMGNFQLDNISLYLPGGYIMGLVGENGAGKTTLLRCLLDIYHKDYGQIQIAGADLDQEEVKAKSALGIVLESSMYEQNLTGLMNARVYGSYFAEYDEGLFLKYMERFGVDPGKKLKRLSKGMEIKFQLALALSHNAQLLILDEPAGNLDETSRKELSQLLQEFISNGRRSVLLSTHITAQLDEIADYITYLHKGKILFSYDRESLYDRYMLVSGEDYKIRLIPKELLVGAEKHSYSTEALVRQSGRYRPDPEVTVSRPTIERIMYYMDKGGFANV